MSSSVMQLLNLGVRGASRITPEEAAANTTDVQRLLWPTVPSFRRRGSQAYLGDVSTLGDVRWPPQLGRCYLFDGTDDKLEWTTADIGTLYVSYYSVTATSWIDTSITHASGKYTFTVGAIRVWNLKLWTDNLATTEQKQATEGVPANLWVWLKCDDNHATLAYDSSGNGRNGTKAAITTGTFHATSNAVPFSWQNTLGYTLSGSTLVPRDESDTTEDVLGGSLTYTGREPYDASLHNLPCVTLNGTSEYLQCDTLANGDPLTISGWIKTTDTDGVIVGKWLDTEQSWKLSVTSTKLTFNNGSGTSATTAINDGAWHHFAITHAVATGAVTFYLDGVADGSGGTFTLADSTAPIQIGQADGGDFLTGSLFDVRIFSVAKTQPQLASIMAGDHVATGWVETFPVTERSGPTVHGLNGTELTITSSALSTVWGTGNTINDLLVRNGGRYDSGAWIPGNPVTGLAANGEALTFGPNEMPSDGSYLDREPYSAPALLLAELAAGAVLNNSEEAADSNAEPNDAILELKGIEAILDEDDELILDEDDQPITTEPTHTIRHTLRTP